jgi:hypothetical protein
MPRKANHRQPTGPRKETPIKPGSLLYRILQQIAQEVAKSMELQTPMTDRPRPKE